MSTERAKISADKGDGTLLRMLIESPKGSSILERKVQPIPHVSEIGFQAASTKHRVPEWYNVFIVMKAFTKETRIDSNYICTNNIYIGSKIKKKAKSFNNQIIRLQKKL